MTRFLLILFLPLLAFAVNAASGSFQFKDPAQEKAFQQLTQQLRCPKCQNTSIADSNAPIAADLRQKVYELMQQGQTESQIIDFMVTRYGNFVSYDPPVNGSTLILWLLPALFLIGGTIIALRGGHRFTLSNASGTPLSQASATKVVEGSHVRLYLVPVLLSIALSIGIFAKTNGITEVQHWRQAVKQTPQLLQRAKARTAPLTQNELDVVELGLRTRVNDHPKSLADWELLRQVYQARNEVQNADFAARKVLSLSSPVGYIPMDKPDMTHLN